MDIDSCSARPHLSHQFVREPVSMSSRDLNRWLCEKI
ncbi:hypothetical protein M5D96_013874 [Drosophila gunungcola]|uniref:Uncharacterized protein n=1 Tax=Drosophila gunungcola TaxID=103775 RepID=A0A9P9YAI0_9MUSC|nr:hypothetical protein M5D96_013874 [Drosophila gunungcola]